MVIRSMLLGAQRASHHAIARSLALSLLAVAVAAPAVAAGEPGSPTVSAATEPTVTPSTVTVQTVYAPYLSVETYYLKLLNCTRTGGWVTSSGTCLGYGSGKYSRYVKPLVRSVGISDRVSRPYAKLLAVRGICSHYANGDPGYRLRKAGYTSYRWGENIGCRDGYSSSYTAVLLSHRYFQAEKSTNGGHWRNIKEPRFTAVGIGVWRYSGRTRLVTDFYRPY